MFSATGGVNTHKGLIFASAILCGALGKVYKDAFLLGKKPPVPLDAVVGECKKLGSCSLKDFKAEDRRQDVSAGAGRRRSPEETAGERIHTAYGIAGARGEAALGFPSALTIGLPALKAWLSQGFSLNDAAVLTLLSLLSQVDDTNMIHPVSYTHLASGTACDQDPLCGGGHRTLPSFISGFSLVHQLFDIGDLLLQLEGKGTLLKRQHHLCACLLYTSRCV